MLENKTNANPNHVAKKLVLRTETLQSLQVRAASGDKAAAISGCFRCYTFCECCW